MYDLAGRGAEALSRLITPETVEKVQATVGRLAAGVGKVDRQIIDALAPAMPFLQNVLLPLLKGIGKGVIVSIVGAFKIAIPIIKLIATGLGAVGKVLAPFKGTFEKVGMVIGVVFSGPILKLLGLIPQARCRVPGVGAPDPNGDRRVPWRRWRDPCGVVMVCRALVGAQRFVGTFTGMPARVARAALNLVGRVMNAIESLPGRMLSGGKRAVTALVSGIRSVGSKVLEAGKPIGTKIVKGIIDFIKASPGKIKDAVMSVVPGPVKSVIKTGLGWTGLATGGTVVKTGWAVVGERGPELLRLPGGSTVFDHEQPARARQLPAMRGAPWSS